MNRTATRIKATGHPYPFNTLQETELSGYGSTERAWRTLAAMAAFAHSGACGEHVQRLASLFTLGPDISVLSALWLKLKNGQHHVPDPVGVELLRHPEQSASALLGSGKFDGDCDDVAMLAASVCIVLGIPCQFRVTARSGQDWEHVYLVAGSRRMFAIDPQETSQFGDERAYEAALNAPVWETHS